MNRAVVTYFDGDPFTINTWLLLYEKYWRDECSKVYAGVAYNENSDDKVKQYNARRFAEYPEIEVTVWNDVQYPEIGNAKLLEKVSEDYVGLIESDGLVYGRGIVDQCFKLLENEKQDIVAPPWYLIDEPYFNGDLQSTGFMRCFFFTKRKYFDKIEIDLMPRTIPKNTRLNDMNQINKDVALDCFGWISWQLLLLGLKITYTPNNILTPDNILSPYSNFKWVHIRQMSSSALGMGGAEYKLWTKGQNGDVIKRVFELFDEHYPDGPAEFIYIKAIAFKLLFYDLLKDKQDLGNFATDYRQMLQNVIDWYNMPINQIFEIKGFFKGLFNI